MNRRVIFIFSAVIALLICLMADLSIGAIGISWRTVIGAFVRFDADNYDHFVVLYQRFPRALIAVYVGATMATGGLVLQGLTRNPLAAPATLGINAGATLFVVAAAYALGLGAAALGVAALLGGVTGFLCCLAVARLADPSRDPRGLALILSGALVSMLFIGLANAFLLADPARRTDFLGWVTGNINHVYADRLALVWPIGLSALSVLMLLARPLTLITLGVDKAASAGVAVARVTWLALAAVTLGSASAVAICGPVGFIGLIVPHMVRPFVGSSLVLALPTCAVTGAAVCLVADLIARQALAPYVLHTGLIMDLLGGLIFVLIVRRFYLQPGARSAP
ncbi:FecCD family ABC transporter permease [Consotaella aegiceratis]|uniref:FecCD family ABC transporter permease n=1 Tax=Consotaella aegiceratis TaxID=3097961 RepID=UPI002F427063